MSAPAGEKDLKDAQDSLAAARKLLLEKWAETIALDDSFDFTFGDPGSTPFALRVHVYFDNNGDTLIKMTQSGINDGTFDEGSRITEEEETQLRGVIEEVLPLLDSDIPRFAQAIYSALALLDDDPSFCDSDFDEVERLKEKVKKLRSEIALAKRGNQAAGEKISVSKLIQGTNLRYGRDAEFIRQIDAWVDEKVRYEAEAKKKFSWYSGRFMKEYETQLATRCSMVLSVLRLDEFDSSLSRKHYKKRAYEFSPILSHWMPLFDLYRHKFESFLADSPNPASDILAETPATLLSGLSSTIDKIRHLSHETLIPLQYTAPSQSAKDSAPSATSSTSPDGNTSSEEPTPAPSKVAKPFPPPNLELFEAYDDFWKYMERVTVSGQSGFLYSRHAVSFVPSPAFTFLKHITELNLSENKLTTLSGSIRRLKALKRLILHSNALTSLPPLLDGDGAAFPDLEFLDIHNNKLTSLPFGIGMCAKLSSLDAEKNRITSMSEICTAERLSFVNFTDNQIKLVPATLISLQDLQYLKLKNNPIVNLPPHIYIQGMAAIMTFLQDHTQLDAEALPSSLRTDFWKFRTEDLSSPSSFLDLTLYPGGESNPLEHATPVHAIIAATRLPFLKTALFEKLSASSSSATASDAPAQSAQKLVLDLTRDELDVLVYYAYTDSYSAPEIPKLDNEEDRLPDLEQAKLESIRLELVANWRKTLHIHLALAKKYQLSRLEFLVADRLGIAKLDTKVFSGVIALGAGAAAQSNQTKPKAPAYSPDSSMVYELAPLLSDGVSVTMAAEYDVAFRAKMEPEMPLIRAHKVILCARSPYWKSLLTGGLVESKQAVVELDDISHESLKNLVEFCYTDDVLELNGDTVMELMMKARLFALDRLVAILESAIGYSLDIYNVTSILATASMYHLPRLAKATKFFVMSHWFQVTRDPSWRELDPIIRTRLDGIAIQWGIIPNPSHSSTAKLVGEPSESDL